MPAAHVFNHNEIRRAKKAQQKAQAGKGRSKKVVENFSLQALQQERREAAQRQVDLTKFGQAVNRQIYAWLDLLDAGHPVQVDCFGGEVSDKAIEELVKHIRKQAMPKYFVKISDSGWLLSLKKMG